MVTSTRSFNFGQKTTTVTVEDLDRVATEFVNQVAKEQFDRIVQRTPVREGTARDGWVLTPAAGATPATISNDVEHVIYLELGTYKMAPRAMVRLTLEETDQIVAEVAQRMSK